jgi:hypothetical protein
MLEARDLIPEIDSGSASTIIHFGRVIQNFHVESWLRRKMLLQILLVVIASVDFRQSVVLSTESRGHVFDDERMGSVLMVQIDIQN